MLKDLKKDILKNSILLYYYFHIFKMDSDLAIT